MVTPGDQNHEHGRGDLTLPYARPQGRKNQAATRVLWILVGSSSLMTGGAVWITSTSHVGADPWAALDTALIRAGAIVSSAAVLMGLWARWRHVPIRGANFAIALASMVAVMLWSTW